MHACTHCLSFLRRRVLRLIMDQLKYQSPYTAWILGLSKSMLPQKLVVYLQDPVYLYICVGFPSQLLLCPVKNKIHYKCTQYATYIHIGYFWMVYIYSEALSGHLCSLADSMDKWASWLVSPECDSWTSDWFIQWFRGFHTVSCVRLESLWRHVLITSNFSFWWFL